MSLEATGKPIPRRTGGASGLSLISRGGRTAIALFVGDAKYKNLTDRSTPNADLYQLLAYATALDLPGGTLIYAQDKAEPRTYAVNYAGKRLSVVALDISRPLEDVLEQVGVIARRLKDSGESRVPALTAIEGFRFLAALGMTGKWIGLALRGLVGKWRSRFPLSRE